MESTPAWRQSAHGIIDRLRRPSRYLQIGIVCALSTNTIVIGLDWLGVHYLVSTIFATITVSILGFILHCAYTYRVASSWTRLRRFLAGIASGFVLSLLAMAILCDGMGLSASLAYPLVTVLSFVWNYLAARWAILRRAPQTDPT